jgi:hypothetical protein
MSSVVTVADTTTVSLPIACSGKAGFVQVLEPHLGRGARLMLGEGCPGSATLDARGRLFVSRGGPPQEGHSTAEVLGITTLGKAGAAGWATLHGDARSSCGFTLSSK